MDDEYNLVPGEVLIMSSEGVVLIEGKERQGLDELALTNKNLILVNEVSTGLFSSKRMLKRCPLDLIACPEGIPQAFLGKRRDEYVLQVVFADESLTLWFPDNEKCEAKRWADAIRCAVVGDIDGIETEKSPVPKEVTGLLDGVGGFVGAFLAEASDTAHEATRPRQTPRKTVPPKTAAKCLGCHAPLSGSKGGVVTCDYCGTKQTL